MKPLNTENNELLVEYSREMEIQGNLYQVFLRCYEDPIIESEDVQLRSLLEIYHSGCLVGERFDPGYFGEKEFEEFAELIQSHPELFINSIREKYKNKVR